MTYSVLFYWKDGFELEVPGFQSYAEAERFAASSPNKQSPNYQGHDVIDNYDDEDDTLDAGHDDEYCIDDFGDGLGE